MPKIDFNLTESNSHHQIQSVDNHNNVKSNSCKSASQKHRQSTSKPNFAKIPNTITNTRTPTKTRANTNIFTANNATIMNHLNNNSNVFSNKSYGFKLIIAITFLISIFGSVLAICWDLNNASKSATELTSTTPHHRFIQENNNSINTNCTTIQESTDDGWVNSIPKAVQYTLISILILFSAFFSGLTLSMMGLDTTGLEIVMSGDDPILSRAAGKIYPVRKNGNLLLCTLLLGNVAVNTLLGILMADITGGTVGFITSTALIVIFGEIIPQALFSRYALQVGEKAVPVVKLIIALLYIIAKPLAFCLDKLLGHELGTTYSKAEMSKLLEIHVKEGRFNQEVGTAMQGALQYQDMIVKDVMTPLANTFMINVEDKMNFDMMSTIFKTGYSRIPVYESCVGNVIGLLFVKDLIFIDPEDATPVKSLMEIFGRTIHFVDADDKLGDVLRLLKSGHTHMALVKAIQDNDDGLDRIYTLEGIITLEDIIEEILGDEIVDETDKWVDGEHTEQVSRESAFDWSKLRLLDAKIVDKTLSDDEVRVVAAHLRQNYSATVKDISDKQLRRMIGATAVTELEEVQKEAGEDLPPPAELLYVKNEHSDFCTIILQGKVTVFSGNDNFRSDMSSWSVLATGALTEDDYRPDFNAYVSSGPSRCLQLKRDIFIAACHASTLEKLPEKGNVKSYGTNTLQIDEEESRSDRGAVELTAIGLQTKDKSDTSSVRFANDVRDVHGINESLHSNVVLVDQSEQSSQHSAKTYNGKGKNLVQRSENRSKLLATLFGESGSKRNLQKNPKGNGESK